MSDDSAFLMFFLAGLLLALRWIVADHLRGPPLLAVATLGGMLFLVLWLVLAMRNSAA